MPFKTFYRLCIGLAICFYLLTAINSSGYYHPDEHYQIVEFANFKLGNIPMQELPWEYNAKIRSALQPAICYFVFKMLKAAGIDNPFQLTMTLRILTAVLAILSISVFVRSYTSEIEENNRKVYIFLSYFLLFLPFLDVRFSSETWSGLFFLLGMGVLQSQKPLPVYRFFLIGLLFGMSFLCRFQSAILCAGIIAWLFIVKKEKNKNILVLLLAVTLALMAGMLIDRWFYGIYTYTPWNYFYTALLSDSAPDFGTQPWYYFFSFLLNWSLLPFGFCVLAAILMLIIRRSRSPLLWAIIPFVVVHTVISHKEDRFLFPLANLAPVLLVLAWQEVKMVVKTPKSFHSGLAWVRNACLVFFLLYDMSGLLISSFRPPGEGSKLILSYINREYKGRPVRLLFCNYNPLYAPYEEFYHEKNLKEHMLANVFDLENEYAVKDSFNLLVIYRSDLDDPLCKAMLKKKRFDLELQSTPRWITGVISLYDKQVNGKTLLLYHQASL